MEGSSQSLCSILCLQAEQCRKAAEQSDNMASIKHQGLQDFSGDLRDKLNMSDM